LSSYPIRQDEKAFFFLLRSWSRLLVATDLADYAGGVYIVDGEII
jgi:hypothetical protein